MDRHGAAELGGPAWRQPDAGALSGRSAAAFVVAGDGVAVTPTVGGVPLRCASLLKPLLFWVAADAFADAAAWQAAASPAVTVSANAPTVALWERVGARELLARLAAVTGDDWPLEPGGARGFGRVLVTAPQVARAYAALAAAGACAGDERAERVLAWMRAVPERQTFGARAAAAGALCVPESEVAVKCGWFLDADEPFVRTHAATITALDDGTLRGSVVLTAVPAPDGLHERYAREYVEGDEVLHHHRALAGDLIVAETRAALGSGMSPAAVNTPR
jgi:hypothetical protein